MIKKMMKTLIINLINNKILSNFILALIALSTIFTPIYSILWAVIIVSLIDLFTAIGKDFRLHRKDKVSIWKKLTIIKSRKLRRTTIKIILYLILVMLLHLIPYVCFGSGLYIANIGGFMILANELHSIGENMNIITGDNIFSKIIKKSIKEMNEWLNKKIED